MKNHFIILFLTATLMGLITACEKKYVTEKITQDKIILIDTLFISDTIVSTEPTTIELFRFKTSKTKQATASTRIVEIATGDFKFLTLRQPLLGCFAWTNNVSNEPSFDGRGLIRFEELSLLPEVIKIDSVFITLHVREDGTTLFDGPSGQNNVSIHRITAPWYRNSVNWVNQPTYNTINSVSSGTIDNSTDSLRLNITSIASDLNTTENNGFLLKMTNETLTNASVWFYSSEWEDEDKRPYLELYFHEI